MASVANQPSFWLDVKKEYVIDNFENLLVYLCDYTYIDEEEKPEGDFNRTFKCLKAVVEDYIKEAEEDCFFDHVSMRWREKTPFVIRAWHRTRKSLPPESSISSNRVTRETPLSVSR